MKKLFISAKALFFCLTMQRYGENLAPANRFSELPKIFSEKGDKRIFSELHVWREAGEDFWGEVA